MGDIQKLLDDLAGDYRRSTYSGWATTSTTAFFGNYSYCSSFVEQGIKECLFRGIWMDFTEWKKAIKKSLLEVKWPKKIIPTGIVNSLQKSFRKKLPSWSSRRWKSKT